MPGLATLFFFCLFINIDSKYGRQRPGINLLALRNLAAERARILQRARHGDASALESECEVAGGLVLVPAMRGEPLVTECFLFFFLLRFRGPEGILD